MRTVLVAVDGSDVALRGVDYAARHAELLPDTQVHVLYVQPPIRVYGEIEVYVGEERMRDMAAQEARAALESARGRLEGKAGRIELEHLEGDPAETIVRRATELGCESIVMGTHGRGRLGTAILGSVAQQVVHHSPAPVTLVR